MQRQNFGSGSQAFRHVCNTRFLVTLHPSYHSIVLMDRYYHRKTIASCDVRNEELLIAFIIIFSSLSFRPYEFCSYPVSMIPRSQYRSQDISTSVLSATYITIRRRAKVSTVACAPSINVSPFLATLLFRRTRRFLATATGFPRVFIAVTRRVLAYVRACMHACMCTR